MPTGSTAVATGACPHTTEGARHEDAAITITASLKDQPVITGADFVDLAGDALRRQVFMVRKLNTLGTELLINDRFWKQSLIDSGAFC